MTIPSLDSLSTYGGAKQNYAPVEDPTTDRDASDANQAYCSVAAMTKTAPRAIVTFTAAATTNALVLNSYVAAWPTVGNAAPTLSRSSTGSFVVIFPNSVVDELGVSHLLSFRYVTARARGGATCFHAQGIPNSGCLAQVTTFLANGTSDDCVSTSFDVYIY